MEQGETRRHKRHILDDRENESRRVGRGVLRGAAADAGYERTLPGFYIHLVPDTIKLTKGSIVCCGRRTRPTTTTGSIFTLTQYFLCCSVMYVADITVHKLILVRLIKCKSRCHIILCDKESFLKRWPWKVKRKEI